MICRRCSHKIKDIDTYCRSCGLKTYNEDKKIEADLLAKQMKNLNSEDNELKNKSNLSLLTIGICVIIMLILIMMILIYTIIKNR